ncbi:Hypp5094 [Branchiostoma lanceolatum]|uniref:Hypp5094 protein n=1 Tax=Branchiostoma lanceolatum TaxID=7740 RepID=A0A8K0ACD7_BRALA|nr:Hypp5094 [Branchiostoma lanceolatum]
MKPTPHQVEAQVLLSPGTCQPQVRVSHELMLPGPRQLRTGLSQGQEGYNDKDNLEMGREVSLVYIFLHCRGDARPPRWHGCHHQGSTHHQQLPGTACLERSWKGLGIVGKEFKAIDSCHMVELEVTL